MFSMMGYLSLAGIKSLQLSTLLKLIETTAQYPRNYTVHNLRPVPVFVSIKQRGGKQSLYKVFKSSSYDVLSFRVISIQTQSSHTAYSGRDCHAARTLQRKNKAPALRVLLCFAQDCQQVLQIKQQSNVCLMPSRTTQKTLQITVRFRETSWCGLK